jgi:hypothetical protein
MSATDGAETLVLLDADAEIPTMELLGPALEADDATGSAVGVVLPKVASVARTCPASVARSYLVPLSVTVYPWALLADLDPSAGSDSIKGWVAPDAA